jgi:hypothetical protein
MVSRRALLLLLLLPAPTAADVADVSGSWSGSGRLTNDWPGLACVYDGSAAPGSVKMELARRGETLSGTILLEFAPAAGSGCPPLRKQYLVTEASVTESTLRLVDSGGLEWNLSIRQGGASLVGLLAWKEGGAPEALAAGFSAQGKTPLVRLSGEVQLERPGAAKPAAPAAPAAAAVPAPPRETAATETPAASPSPSPSAAAGGGAAPKKVSAGDRVGHVAAILGANVVAAGAIYGVNKLGQGGSTSGTSCSPRNCFIGAPGEPCLCNANVLAGAPCNTVPGGVPLGGACDGTTRPCQSGFSCNGGVCQDGSGACPY